MLIYSTLGIELRISRCLVFKDYTMRRMIPDRRRVFHPPYSHRILYAGHDLALLEFLRETLTECQIVRAPSGCVARILIEWSSKFSILLFDEVLPDTTGLRLACLTRELAHREQTPIIIVKQSDEFEALARAITQLLVTQE